MTDTPQWDDRSVLWVDPPVATKVDSATAWGRGTLAQMVQMFLEELPPQYQQQAVIRCESASGDIHFEEASGLAQLPSYPYRVGG